MAKGFDTVPTHGAMYFLWFRPFSTDYWAAQKKLTGDQPSERVTKHFTNISSPFQKNVVAFWFFVNHGSAFSLVESRSVSWCHNQWAEDWLQILLTCLWEIHPQYFTQTPPSLSGSSGIKCLKFCSLAKSYLKTFLIARYNIVLFSFQTVSNLIYCPIC